MPPRPNDGLIDLKLNAAPKYALKAHRKEPALRTDLFLGAKVAPCLLSRRW
jgi:hypothetical protein